MSASSTEVMDDAELGVKTWAGDAGEEVLGDCMLDCVSMQMSTALR